MYSTEWRSYQTYGSNKYLILPPLISNFSFIRHSPLDTPHVRCPNILATPPELIAKILRILGRITGLTACLCSKFIPT